MHLHTKQKAILVIGCSGQDMKTDQAQQTQSAIIKGLSLQNIKGATISQASGLWEGQTEKSIKLEIINNFTSPRQFKKLINNLYIYLLNELQQAEILTEITKTKTNL